MRGGKVFSSGRRNVPSWVVVRAGFCWLMSGKARDDLQSTSDRCGFLIRNSLLRAACLARDLRSPSLQIAEIDFDCFNASAPGTCQLPVFALSGSWRRSKPCASVHFHASNAAGSGGAVAVIAPPLQGSRPFVIVGTPSRRSEAGTRVFNHALGETLCFLFLSRVSPALPVC